MRRSSGLSGWFSPQHCGCFDSDSETLELRLSSLLPLEAAYPNLYESNPEGLTAFAPSLFWQGNGVSGRLANAYPSSVSTLKAIPSHPLVN